MLCVADTLLNEASYQAHIVLQILFSTGTWKSMFEDLGLTVDGAKGPGQPCKIPLPTPLLFAYAVVFARAELRVK